jgi:hypothetical protein
MTDLSGLSIALGAKPAFAIVAMPMTIAAPKISDRTIVFSPIVARPTSNQSDLAMNQR